MGRLITCRAALGGPEDGSEDAGSHECPSRALAEIEHGEAAAEATSADLP
jgi:hypothetical protein